MKSKIWRSQMDTPWRTPQGSLARRRCLFSCLAIPIAGMAGLDSVEAADAAPALSVLQEIIVTARKREERLLDVPISISAVTGAQLERANANRLEDVATMVPNMRYTPDQIDDGGITIRGISSNDAPGFDPSVGVYLDGVYIARSTAFNGLLMDLERVEVLRGPQATIFGKNSIAGAVNMVTRKPSEEMQIKTDFTYGNYNYVQARATLGGRLTERVNARLAASYRDREGYFENRIGKDGNDDGSVGAALQLWWKVHDDVDALLSLDGVRDRTIGSRQDVVADPLGAKRFFPIADTDPYDRRGSYDDLGIASFNDRDIAGSSLKIDWRIGEHTLTSVTSYRTLDLDIRDDEDQTELNTLVLFTQEDQNQFSQELRLTSASDQRLTWLVGAYWFTQDIENVESGTETLPLVALFRGPPFTATALSTIDEQTYALFGQASYDLTDKLSLTAGIRYTEEDKDMTYRQPVVPDPYPLTFLNFFAIPLTAVNAGNDEWTPSVSLAYQWREDVNAYISYSEGFKGAGFNTFFFVDPQNLSFAPEFVKNYEVGLKSALLDNRLSLNVAVFHMDYTDLQIRSLVNGAFITSNVAEARSRGVEIDAAAKLTDGLDVSVGIGYLDAENVEFVDNDGNDLAGYALPGAAKWQANLAIDYEYPLSSSLRLALRGAAHYSDRYANDPQHTPVFMTDSHILVDARVGVRSADGRWELSLWGKNLTDEDFVASTNDLTDFFGFQTIGLNPPRTYGVQVGFSY